MSLKISSGAMYGGQLYEQALLADPDMQWVEAFALVQLIRFR